MMKKVLFGLAIAGMFGFAACNNNKTAEEPVAEEPVMEEVAEMTDSTAVENAVEEVVDATVEAAAEAATEAIAQ